MRLGHGPNLVLTTGRISRELLVPKMISESQVESINEHRQQLHDGSNVDAFTSKAGHQQIRQMNVAFPGASIFALLLREGTACRLVHCTWTLKHRLNLLLLLLL